MTLAEPDVSASATAAETILDVENLEVQFTVKLPFLQNFVYRVRPVVHAVDGVSFGLRRGEVFGLVGESGSGKTTLGRTVLRLIEPTAGTIRFDGRDVTHMKEKDLRPLRRTAQVIFQDPHASLNPAMTIGRAIGHPLEIHGRPATSSNMTPDSPHGSPRLTEDEIRDEVLRIMREVGLTPADQLYEKYPGDLSGGQKQRTVIARAMILRPKLIVADEPVAMLDMSIRARILELMLQLREKYGLTYLFITHDLATAKFMCDRIAIMYLGRFVEVGDSKSIYREPMHPYTKALLGAIPIPDPDKKRFKTLPSGEVPDAIFPPLGCRFHPRCPVATPSCGWEARDVIEFLESRALQPDTAADDEKAFGPLERLRAEGLHVRIPSGRENAAEIESQVNRLRAEMPTPMAEAIRRISPDRGDLIIEFAPANDPGMRTHEGRDVRCVLY